MERRFKITVDGRPYDVTVEDLSEGSSRLIPGPGDMHVPASAPASTSSLAAPAAGSAPSAGPGDEVSPLAGTVDSIQVSVGQQVKEGDKLGTLEAMKMKTQIIARHNGKIKSIAVKVGDSVDAGQVLFTIG